MIKLQFKQNNITNIIICNSLNNSLVSIAYNGYINYALWLFNYKNQDIIFEFDDKEHATSLLYLNAKGVGLGQQDKSVPQMYEKYYTLKKDSIPNLVVIYHPENENTKYLIEMCKDIGYECKNINHIMVYYNKSLLKN